MKKYWLLIAWVLYSSIVFSQNILQASQTVGCAPMLVKFSSSITLTDVVQWRWNLGDGNTSLQQNPVYVYTTPGVFTVTLTITRSNGIVDSFTQNQMITVGAKPTVEFSTTQTVVCNPDTVFFTNTSSSNGTPIASYNWNFGDGSTSAAAQPIKQYNFADTFSVFLKVTNILGCEASLEKRQYIIAKTKPSVQLNLVPFNKCTAPATVSFQNNSSGPPTLSYLWQMGDGTTYTTPQVSHTFTQNGLYTPVLTTTSSNGCFTTVALATPIQLGGFVTRFSGVDTTCLGITTLYTNNSSPAPISSSWLLNNSTIANTYNLQYVFSQTGTASLALVNNFGTCTDTVRREITVNDGFLNLQFTASRLRGTCAPFTTTFTSNVPTASGITYLWNFGDGNTSTDAVPTHTYAQVGEYDVQLTVTLPNSCQRTTLVRRYIIVAPPIISNRMNFSNGCAPHRTNVFTSVNAVVPVAYYIWDFGNGTTVQTSQVVATAEFLQEGVYVVNLTVVFTDSCRSSVQMFDPIRVSSKPTANFSFSPTQGCTNVPFQFNNLSSNFTNVLWQFFNPRPFQNTTQNSPNIIFTDTGTVTIRLIASNNGCTDTMVVPQAFRLTPPYADFLVSGICGIDNRFVRRFTNRSLAKSGTTYLWDFGDGNSTSVFAPTHVYSTTGVYNITLTATGDSCSTTITKSVRIKNDYDFTASETSVCRGRPVRFRLADPSVTNLDVFWQFGDGTSAVHPPGVSAVKFYNANGVYTVKAIFFNALTQCSDTIVYENLITVIGPVASLLTNSTSPAGCAGVQVRVLADSSSGIQTYRMFWGDGNSSSSTSPSFTHTYTTNGFYTVKLEVLGSGCVDTISYPNYFSISKVQANFTSNATVSCPGAPIQLTATGGTGVAPVRYRWLVGGSQILAGSTVTTSFATAGTYDVRLIATDANNCTDTLIRNNYFTIVQPRASFTVSDSALICTPSTVQYSFTGANNSSSLWSFGDATSSIFVSPSKTYTAAGTYPVRLVITAPGGCTDSAFKIITVRSPQPSYSFSGAQGCLPLRVGFSNSSNGGDTYVWIYGDGFTSHTSQLQKTHTYTRPGAFVPQLFVVDDGGCLVAVPVLDTVKSFGVLVSIPTIDSFYCDAALVPVTANIVASYTQISSVRWQVNGTAVATGLQANIPLPTLGNYRIQCIATTPENCADTFTVMPTPTRVLASPRPSLLLADTVCEQINLPIRFTPATGAGISYTWQYNGVLVSNSATPPAIPTVPGLQSLVLLSSNGFCTDTIQKNIQVIAKPAVDFAAAQLCIRTLAQLRDSTVLQNDTIVARRWLVNNALIST
ncbi:MAG: PKD domain-containing protein, partial [Bacteroidetes bacterium]